MSSTRGASIGGSSGTATLDLNINLTVNGVSWEPSVVPAPPVAPVPPVAPAPPGALELGITLVAAAYVGPTGGLTTPPQFATPGLAVVNLGPGTYRLTFPTFAPDRRYLVTGSALADRTGEPRIFERFTGDEDDALGLHLLIRGVSGRPINGSFWVQVHEYSGSPV